jgi:hypothetical protein
MPVRIGGIPQTVMRVALMMGVASALGVVVGAELVPYADRHLIKGRARRDSAALSISRSSHFPSAKRRSTWNRTSAVPMSRLAECAIFRRRLEAPPGFEPGMEVLQQGQDVYLVDSSCFLVGVTPPFSLVVGRYCSQVVPSFRGLA